MTDIQYLILSSLGRNSISDSEHLTAFGLQVDDSQVVTFSYTYEGVGDVEGNINGYICEADGTFQFTVLPA